MHTTFRAFLVQDDGTLRRLSKRLINDLVHGRQTLPEYANQSRRILWLWLRAEGRRLLALVSVEGSIWEFDEKGDMQLSLTRYASEAIDALPGKQTSTPQGRVVSMAPHLARKRTRERWHWEPTEEQINQALRLLGLLR